MTIKSTAIALTTAVAIGFGSLVPAGPAQAQPFAAFKHAQIETGAEGVEEVGRRRARRLRHRRRHRHNDAAAAAVIGLGAFALGAAIASGAQARDCYYQRVKIWDPALGAYVVRRQRVC
jgi:hypothetical protein